MLFCEAVSMDKDDAEDRRRAVREQKWLRQMLPYQQDVRMLYLVLNIPRGTR